MVNVNVKDEEQTNTSQTEGDRDSPLLHDLKKGRLRLWRGAVYLVGQHQVGENRPCLKLELAPARFILDDKVGAHDVGRAINPMATEGQIRGGVTQGLGWTLMENMAYENGKIINADFVDYIVPSALDVPEIKPILVEPIEPNGPYGAKGIGEPALNPTMAAITNAIYNAVGVRVDRLPVDQEDIVRQLGKLPK